MIRVITISREYGAGGASVAGLLAERLGWRLLDRELLRQVSRAAQVEPEVAEQYDERVDPWLHRLVKQALGHGTIDRPTSLADGDLFDAEIMVSVCRRVIEEAARIGECVIVGRGAQCILHGREDVFRVFLYAPLALRAQRMAERLGPRADLEDIIRENDSARAAYIRRYFAQDWCNPYLYELMLNTRYGYAAAADAILTAASLRTALAAH
ncbi:MAG TPA: cytidylate kinase-like family protein [Bryobacteraceae bacterium]|nr:cytidylate kinase-like family protein [Bryobacteraceae bacterium]